MVSTENKPWPPYLLLPSSWQECCSEHLGLRGLSFPVLSAPGCLLSSKNYPPVNLPVDKCTHPPFILPGKFLNESAHTHTHTHTHKIKTIASERTKLQKMVMATLCPEASQGRSWVSWGMIPCMGNDTQMKLPFCNFKDTCTGGKVTTGPRRSQPGQGQGQTQETVQGPAISGPHPKPNIKRKEKTGSTGVEKAVIDLSF